MVSEWWGGLCSCAVPCLCDLSPYMCHPIFYSACNPHRLSMPLTLYAILPSCLHICACLPLWKTGKQAVVGFRKGCGWAVAGLGWAGLCSCASGGWHCLPPQPSLYKMSWHSSDTWEMGWGRRNLWGGRHFTTLSACMHSHLYLMTPYSGVISSMAFLLTYTLLL